MSTNENSAALEQALLKQGRKLLKTESVLNLMVLGEPGIGKSTLVNGLIGDEVAEVSATGHLATQGITNEVKMHPYRKNNANINIWDTPGLLDPTCDVDRVLTNIVEVIPQIDLFLFCVKMDQTRYLPDNKVKKIMAKITEVAGKDIWKKTLIVLTRANVVIMTIADTEPTEDAQFTAFQSLFDGFKNEITKDLKQYSICGLHFALAGRSSHPKLFQRDDRNWLSAFWEKCFEQIGSTHGKIALVKVNTDRLETKTKAKDSQEEKATEVGTKIESQKIELSEDFLKKAITLIVAAIEGGGAGRVLAVAATTAVAAAATAAAFAVASKNPALFATLAASAIGGGLLGLGATLK